MTANAKDIVSDFLPLSSLIFGYLMVFSPTKAAKRVYKFDEKVIKSPVIDLIVANGAATFSLAVLESLLTFTNIDSYTAVSIATIPRFVFLIYNIASKTTLSKTFFKQSNMFKIVVATSLIEGRWLESTLSMQVRGCLYLILGVLFTVSPNYVAKRSTEFDPNPTIARCFRARGKMDMVFGTLVFNLATKNYFESLGLACVAWFLTSLYADFLVSSEDRFRSDAFAQLAIASSSAYVLLSA